MSLGSAGWRIVVIVVFRILFFLLFFVFRIHRGHSSPFLKR
jgi:hypothetical protein